MQAVDRFYKSTLGRGVFLAAEAVATPALGYITAHFYQSGNYIAVVGSGFLTFVLCSDMIKNIFYLKDGEHLRSSMPKIAVYEDELSRQAAKIDARINGAAMVKPAKPLEVEPIENLLSGGRK
jgi:hypothetical protein